MLDTACAQAWAWNQASGRRLKISVNISRRQLADENFLEIVEQALADSQLDPELLELELTELVAMEGVELTQQRLEKLQRMGVRVAIDDFGCGYSSMDHLRRFPVNTLKIDRSFVWDLEEDDQAIVSAIIYMAHQMRLKTIAEGVETKAQLAILSDLGCDAIQGYLLSKGVPADDAWGLIERDQP